MSYENHMHSNDIINIEAYNNSKHRAIIPRSLNWQLCQKIDYAIWSNSVINIDIRWSKNRFSAESIVIYIQNVRMTNLQKTFQFLKYICDNARLVTKLYATTRVFETRVLNALLRLVNEAKNVRLEEIHFRRRYVGQQFSALVDVVRIHARTLRIIEKLGLGEAVQAFQEKLKLERCSLMNFDLIENEQMESAELMDATRSCIRRLGGLGTTFSHLSLTAFSGIEISRQPMIHFLRSCGVQSIRLTMQNGIPLPATAYPRVLLYGMRKIELIGQIKMDSEARLEMMFPDLEYFDYKYVDLATGTEPDTIVSNTQAFRDRTVSEAISEIDGIPTSEIDFDNDIQEIVAENYSSVPSMAAAC